jgi:hypothetical protein
VTDERTLNKAILVRVILGLSWAAQVGVSSLPMRLRKKALQLRYTAWLILCLAVIGALYLGSAPGIAQAQQASTTPYPGPIPTYSSGNPAYPGPQTATFVPTVAPTQATTAAAGLPSPTNQATAAQPNQTDLPAIAPPEAQSTLDLQANPQSSGTDSTYVPLPAITFQLPDQSTAAAAPLSQSQTPATAVVSQGSGGAARWVPLGVILVIWALLAGWFYLSFRRLG